MATAFQPNAFQNNAFQIETVPAVVVSRPGGGDSTRLRKRGKRPKYFWEAALERKEETKVAEAVFDAVADAYLIEKRGELVSQMEYLRGIERRLEKARFDELAHQVEIALKDLSIRLETRRRNEELSLIAQEESEFRELLEIID